MHYERVALTWEPSRPFRVPSKGCLQLRELYRRSEVSIGDLIHTYGVDRLVSNCARPTRPFRGRALREQRRLTGHPFPSYTGRGAKPAGLVSDRTRSSGFMEFLPSPLEFFLNFSSSSVNRNSSIASPSYHNQLPLLTIPSFHSSSSSPAHSLLMYSSRWLPIPPSY